jgi:hypothetical protein
MITKKQYRRLLAKLPIDVKLKMVINMQRIARALAPNAKAKKRRIVWE